MAQSNMTSTVGLALEGGGYRGMYTAGVLDVWMEHGLTCDHMVGVSAGAAFGYNFKSRQIGRAIRYNKVYCTDKRYASVTSWLRTGDMFNADFAYHEVPIERDPIDLEAYRACPMRFTCVYRYRDGQGRLPRPALWRRAGYRVDPGIVGDSRGDASRCY